MKLSSDNPDNNYIEQVQGVREEKRNIPVKIIFKLIIYTIKLKYYIYIGHLLNILELLYAILIVAFE